MDYAAPVSRSINLLWDDIIIVWLLSRKREYLRKVRKIKHQFSSRGGFHDRNEILTAVPCL